MREVPEFRPLPSPRVASAPAGAYRRAAVVPLQNGRTLGQVRASTTLRATTAGPCRGRGDGAPSAAFPTRICPPMDLDYRPDAPCALEGVRVLDISRLVAGNAISHVLADHGAEVVKVEDPAEGDALRHWTAAGVACNWKVYARNKKSISLNLRSERGREVLLELLRTAQVLVENFKAGALERMGLGPDVLLARNPKLVVARVSGYGQNRPIRPQAGFRHAGRGDVGLRLQERPSRQAAGPAAAGARRQCGRALRRVRRDGGAPRSRVEGRRRPGDRPLAAGAAGVHPGPGRRDPQRDRHGAGPARQRVQHHLAAQCLPDEGRRVDRHERLHAVHGDAHFPHHRPRRYVRRPPLQHAGRAFGKPRGGGCHRRRLHRGAHAGRSDGGVRARGRDGGADLLRRAVEGRPPRQGARRDRQPAGRRARPAAHAQCHPAPFRHAGRHPHARARNWRA